MFESARLKLTAWYLLIIMLISGFFSVAFYHAATQEVQIIIDRIEYAQERMRDEFPSMPPRFRDVPPFTLEELEAVKSRIMVSLILLNGFILIVAGGVCYFLAGRTLRPIQIMVDEQKQFISNASHELRTPIATMRAEMEASLLEKTIPDNRARELINSNLEEVTTLQNLTNNLLQLAQIHNMQSKQFLEKVTLVDIVATAKKNVQHKAKRKDITIAINVEKFSLFGNKQKLEEVFIILLDNAIKYSPEKSTVSISARKSNRQIIVSVSDAGIGISREDLPHIFERFYRADKSRNEEGYGLGLSIAKKIVEAHNGSITVKSKEKKGTTFIVTLPLKISSQY